MFRFPRCNREQETAAIPRLTLTDARVRALKPRKSTYHVRNAKLRGFGVRVLPSGVKRFFLHSQHRGERKWNLVGDTNAVPVAEARSRAESMLASLRGDAPVDAPPFEAVAEAVFRRYARVWKPRTLYVNRSYYRTTLAPWFAGRPVTDIDRQEVERWFASLRGTPVSADRSMPVLSVILTEAERMGHRPEGSKPCRGIRRYRRKGRERSLTDVEMRRLGARLSAHEGDKPLQVAAVRLLLLTGCRRQPWRIAIGCEPGPGHSALPRSSPAHRALRSRSWGAGAGCAGAGSGGVAVLPTSGRGGGEVHVAGAQRERLGDSAASVRHGQREGLHGRGGVFAGRGEEALALLRSEVLAASGIERLRYSGSVSATPSISSAARCRRLQSSGVLLANIRDFCSD